MNSTDRAIFEQVKREIASAENDLCNVVFWRVLAPMLDIHKWQIDAGMGSVTFHKKGFREHVTNDTVAAIEGEVADALSGTRMGMHSCGALWGLFEGYKIPDDYQLNWDTVQSATKMQTFARKCDTCSSVMNEGYCWGDGEGYACSDECLYVEGYTKEQFDIDFEEDAIYWTQWECPEDHQYFEDGSEI